MWIFLSDSFLSCVASDQDATVLMVRVRRSGDIEAVFGPQTEVITLPGRDYQFRTFIRRDIVGQVIAMALMEIDYGNFKNSVRDPHLHDAYAHVWSVMADLQEVAPYRSRPRPAFSKHPVRYDRKWSRWPPAGAPQHRDTPAPTPLVAGVFASIGGSKRPRDGCSCRGLSLTRARSP